MPFLHAGPPPEDSLIFVHRQIVMAVFIIKISKRKQRFRIVGIQLRRLLPRLDCELGLVRVLIGDAEIEERRIVFRADGEGALVHVDCLVETLCVVKDVAHVEIGHAGVFGCRFVGGYFLIKIIGLIKFALFVIYFRQPGKNLRVAAVCIEQPVVRIEAAVVIFQRIIRLADVLGYRRVFPPELFGACELFEGKVGLVLFQVNDAEVVAVNRIVRRN